MVTAAAAKIVPVPLAVCQAACWKKRNIILSLIFSWLKNVHYTANEAGKPFLQNKNSFPTQSCNYLSPGVSFVEESVFATEEGVFFTEEDTSSEAEGLAKNPCELFPG
ncbi:hypothetical protein Lfee_1681 [Legionella feeleii]|uniref:Uncharacterized protein n=1 Tax=Legionella feeleii TaxID=453 RepID=A0A0W0TMH5_9GAMM|nr:hypothetical protein Lfee_1681 [Legionella feeleii]SPX60559.1 Uncharacterised protein [Legionella feeleii]